MKTKAAAECGIEIELVKLPRSITEDRLISTIKKLNSDHGVHAILLQLPLDSEKNIDAKRCTDTISIDKDVDGLTLGNAGKLVQGSYTLPTLHESHHITPHIPYLTYHTSHTHITDCTSHITHQTHGNEA